MCKLFRNHPLRVCVAWTTCSVMLLPPAVMAEDGLFGIFRGYSDGTPVEQMARQIDRLEKHVDECGSIVIKTPDVWGESRLMRHRADVEAQLKAKLGAFDFRINAVQSTRDAAFLATAVALQEQMVAQVTAAPARGEIAGTATTASTAAVPAVIGSPGDVGALTGGGATTGATSVNGATFGMIADPNAVTTPFVSRSAFYDRGGVVGAPSRTLNVNIEPTIELDQMNRFLQHLNELRRLNEGDDNSDTPGYALNLIRIPVSILPGRRTEQGFGAEVQITIDPYMSDEILPMAFKDFVIKGLVDRIGLDVFQLAQRADIGLLDKDLHAVVPVPAITTTDDSQELNPKSEWKQFKTKEEFYNGLQQRETYLLREYSQKLLDPDTPNAGEAAAKAGLIDPDNKVFIDELSKDTKLEAQVPVDQALQYRLLADVNHRDLSVAASHRGSVNGINSEGLQRIALHAYECLVSAGASSFSKSRENVGVPPSHRLDHGLTMPEVDTLLTREAEAAYQFLAQPSATELWTEFCTPDLPRRVREHRTNYAKDSATTFDSVEYVRTTFLQRVEQTFPGAHNTVTEALAWQIILESALVNEQLISDMKETSILKNCPCIPTDCMYFFGPNPAIEAHEAFRQYVKCKWPIHVFALDPVTQDQNVSDSFSQRREMQMALAIAASNRMLGGQAMSRFVRRMEYDLETISLNRTAIAFSHGDNTFGWRFYPRMQTPPVPGNLQVCVQDMLIGGQDRNRLLNTRRLEPGIRECTALVVMPSFVPQVIVDVRTDWFRLAKHVPFYPFNKRKPDHEDSMELSKQLTELRCLQTQCMNDAHMYRDGDVYRLCKAVERLEDRLPMQSHNVSIPWENDLGGFEVFQSGTQVLGPEIHGWYGAPGILVFNETVKRNALATLARLRESERQAIYNLSILGPSPTTPPTGKWEDATDALALAQANVVTARGEYTALLGVSTDTAVFLVGKNFSVLNCRVIAGGVDVTETIEVINRNLMQVRIPSTVSTVATNHDSGDQSQVVVHLATPYGATSRLLIPTAGIAAQSDVNKSIAEVKKTADKSAAEVQKVSERIPVTLTWGEKSDNLEFMILGKFEQGRFTKSQFNPNEKANEDVRVLQAPDGIFAEKLEKSVGVTGKLLVKVRLPKGDAFNVVVLDLKNGSFNEEDAMTSCDLIEEILESKKVLDKLDVTSTTPIDVVVTGFVKFDDEELPIVRLENTITFKLTPVVEKKM